MKALSREGTVGPSVRLSLGASELRPPWEVTRMSSLQGQGVLGTGCGHVSSLTLPGACSQLRLPEILLEASKESSWRRRPPRPN